MPKQSASYLASSIIYYIHVTPSWGDCVIVFAYLLAVLHITLSRISLQPCESCNCMDNAISSQVRGYYVENLCIQSDATVHWLRSTLLVIIWLVNMGSVLSIQWLLIGCNGAISHNRAKIASDHIIHEKSHIRKICIMRPKFSSSLKLPLIKIFWGVFSTKNPSQKQKPWI